MNQDKHSIWSDRVRRWKESGLSANEYAAEMGIKAKTLTYWQWRLAKEANVELAAGDKMAHQPPFVEIVAPRPKNPAAKKPAKKAHREDAVVTLPLPEPLEIVVRDGLRVRVPVRFDAEALRRVIETLEGR